MQGLHTGHYYDFLIGVNIVHDGHMLAEIGVSGDRFNQDTKVAKAGIAD